jgi:hypothetical protein
VAIRRSRGARNSSCAQPPAARLGTTALQRPQPPATFRARGQLLPCWPRFLPWTTPAPRAGVVFIVSTRHGRPPGIRAPRPKRRRAAGPAKVLSRKVRARASRFIVSPPPRSDRPAARPTKP